VYEESMTQRDRSPQDERALAAPRRPAPPPAGSWDDLFPNAPPAQQRALLALAASQGVLYAPQLAAAPRRSLLLGLLNGQLQDLESFIPPAVEPFDRRLDARQREAVARALHSPDVCLIQGGPGVGKSRVVAELIAQATARGERVLLLAPSAAGLDHTLADLVRRDGVLPLRGVGAGERSEDLGPTARRLTFAEQVRAFEHNVVAAARRSVDEARRNAAARRADEPRWTALAELAVQHEQSTQRIAHLVERLSHLDGECAAEAATPEQVEAETQVAKRLAERRAAAEKLQADLGAARRERETLRPLAEARKSGRWWTARWWRARFRSDLLPRLEQLTGTIEDLEREQSAAAAEVAAQEAVLAQLRAEYAADRARRRAAAVERRRAEIDAERLTREQEQRRLDEQWTAVSRGLSPGAPTPTARTAAVAEARAAWEQVRREDEQKETAAQQWAEAVEQAWPTFGERLLASVNLAAATTTGLASDPQLGERVVPQRTFDLLILEEAEQVTETEFLAAARRARRWVLVGEPSADPDEVPRHVPGKPARPAALRPGFFQRLWQRLHGDPRRLPYAWLQRNGSLVCRLRPLTPEQEHWLETERVADRPDIELRIASPPRQPPQLAEVIFPGSTEVREAKAYIFRELEELAVQATGCGLCWDESDGRLRLQLSEAAPVGDAVALEPGVCEWLAPRAVDGAAEAAPWQTAALEFDRAAGWDRTRAEAWTRRHLPLRLLGRSVALTCPHRMQPGLACVLAELLTDDIALYTPTTTPASDGEAFAFVPVPNLIDEPRSHVKTESRQRGGGTATAAPRQRQVRGGAGLEVDLADARRLDAMPYELRAALPAQGLVNYLEAQAVVRALEGLAADSAFRSRAVEWRQCAVCADCGASHRPAVAVIALYPAQVELLRRLIERSPALTATELSIAVGLPAAFRQRECLAALVSLTRSHSHRAVTFGDDPHALILALTRATERLLLFGDPGTVARRTQWGGPVDHLDETAAARERGLLQRLLAQLHGPPQPAGRHREDSP
jgi:hypothetical protein